MQNSRSHPTACCVYWIECERNCRSQNVRRAWPVGTYASLGAIYARTRQASSTIASGGEPDAEFQPAQWKAQSIGLSGVACVSPSKCVGPGGALICFCKSDARYSTETCSLDSNAGSLPSDLAESCCPGTGYPSNRNGSNRHSLSYAHQFQLLTVLRDKNDQLRDLTPSRPSGKPNVTGGIWERIRRFVVDTNYGKTDSLSGNPHHDDGTHPGLDVKKPLSRAGLRFIGDTARSCDSRATRRVLRLPRRGIGAALHALDELCESGIAVQGLQVVVASQGVRILVAERGRLFQMREGIVRVP